MSSLADDPEDWCPSFVYGTCTCPSMCPDDRPDEEAKS